MEKINFIYWFVGVLSMWVGVLAYGPMKNLWYVIKSSISHRKTTIDATPVIQLQQQIDDLQTQVDNLAERLTTRDANRKNNTRREIRDYLEELRTK